MHVQYSTCVSERLPHAFVCLFLLEAASLLACTLSPLKAKNNKRNHFPLPGGKGLYPRSRRQWLGRRRRSKEVPHQTPTSLVSCSTRTRRVHTARSGGGGAHWLLSCLTDTGLCLCRPIGIAQQHNTNIPAATATT